MLTRDISQRKYNRATTDNINYTSFDGSTINTHGRFRICVFHSIVPCFTLFLCPKFVYSSCSINSDLGCIHESCLRSLYSFLPCNLELYFAICPSQRFECVSSSNSKLQGLKMNSSTSRYLKKYQKF